MTDNTSDLLSPDDLLSSGEVASEYKIARKTVQRWERTNPPRLKPAIVLPGATGAHLFRREDVEAAMAQYKKRPTKDTPADEIDES